MNQRILLGLTLGSTVLLAQACAGLAAKTGSSPATAAAGTTPAQAGTTPAADPNTLKLALKYVEFVDTANKPELTQSAVDQVTAGINQLYAQCNVQFKVEEYVPIVPESKGLAFNTASMAELDPIRNQFDTPNKLVVVNTGPWDHSSMGSANAWTAMPGQSPSGAVIEGPVGNFAGIVAHELGHYLSLDHVSDPAYLMNPIIYDTSTKLDDSECSAVRSTAQTVRAAALRA